MSSEDVIDEIEENDLGINQRDDGACLDPEESVATYFCIIIPFAL